MDAQSSARFSQGQVADRKLAIKPALWLFRAPPATPSPIG